MAVKIIDNFKNFLDKSGYINENKYKELLTKHKELCKSNVELIYAEELLETLWKVYCINEHKYDTIFTKGKIMDMNFDITIDDMFLNLTMSLVKEEIKLPEKENSDFNHSRAIMRGGIITYPVSLKVQISDDKTNYCFNFDVIKGNSNPIIRYADESCYEEPEQFFKGVDTITFEHESFVLANEKINKKIQQLKDEIFTLTEIRTIILSKEFDTTVDNYIKKKINYNLEVSGINITVIKNKGK